MMNKEDKQFILDALSDLKKGLHQRMEGVEGRIGEMDERLSGRIQEMDGRLSSQIKGMGARMEEMDERLSGRIQEMDERLSAEIRHTGVYIESVYDEVRSLAENVSDFNKRTDYLGKAVAHLQNETVDLPAIRTVVKKHSRQLAGLRAK